MSDQSDSIVQHLRSVALQIRPLSLQESRSIDQVANGLRDLFASDGDLQDWIDREESLGRTAEGAAVILGHRSDEVGRDLANVLRDLPSRLRGVRAVTLRKRFPELPDKLASASTSILRESLAARLRSDVTMPAS